MAKETDSLLLEIARCPKMRTLLSSPDANDRCNSIVRCQGSPAQPHQLPEPWSGDLETAPILFLSSNPSIAECEEYPTAAWSDEDIIDFFTNRFQGGSRQWVKDSRYPLMKDGTYKANWVRFWAAVRRRADELLQKKTGPQPGIDYALSEVVHCKSRGEQGVGEAVTKCSHRYLRRMVEASGARVVVCLGSRAAEAVRSGFGVDAASALAGPVAFGGRDRHFAFLPHPNARTNRTLAACLSEPELECLRRAVQSS